MIAGTGVLAPDPSDPRDWSKDTTGVDSPPDAFQFDPGLLPPVVHQGTTSGCTGAAASVAAAVLIRRIGTFYSKTRVSWLWSYHWNRVKSGITGDRGAYPRSTMKALSEVGVIPESLMSSGFFTVLDPPPKRAKRAVAFHIKGYERIPSIAGNSETIVKVLGTEHLPVLIATRIYTRAWEQADRTGIIGQVDTREDEDRGLHMVCLIGYRRNEATRCGWEFLFRNSWGPGWGRDGNAWISGDILENDWVTPDLWTFSRRYW